MKQGQYILGISNAVPPMTGGHGRAFRDLISDVKNLIVLLPTLKDIKKQPFKVKNIFYFNALKIRNTSFSNIKCCIYNFLCKIEICILPITWIMLGNSGKPFLVIASGPLFNGGLGAILIKKFLGVPFIIHVHGEELSILSKKSCVKELIYFKMVKTVLQNARGVICNSKNTKLLACEHFRVKSEKAKVIYPSIDINKMHSDNNGLSIFGNKLVDDEKYILLVGRLNQTRKGFDKAIESLPIILKIFPFAKLIIAGPGNQEELKAFCRKFDVVNNVIFLGKVKRDQLINLYAFCDVFLFPAREMANGDIEGFGITILEANAMGRPVVVGRSGGTVEAVIDGETGLLVDGNSIHQISEAVILLLRDKAYAENLGYKGQIRVLNDFNTRIQSLKSSEIIKKFCKKV